MLKHCPEMLICDPLNATRYLELHRHLLLGCHFSFRKARQGCYRPFLQDREIPCCDRSLEFHLGEKAACLLCSRTEWALPR
jgi:hypothetical protein